MDSDLSPAAARVILQDVLTRMSDADVLALWHMLASWFPDVPRPPHALLPEQSER